MSHKNISVATSLHYKNSTDNGHVQDRSRWGNGGSLVSKNTSKRRIIWSGVQSKEKIG